MFSTVGFGDFVPENSIERFMCLLLMLWGILLFGNLLAELADINHAANFAGSRSPPESPHRWHPVPCKVRVLCNTLSSTHLPPCHTKDLFGGTKQALRCNPAGHRQRWRSLNKVVDRCFIIFCSCSIYFIYNIITSKDSKIHYYSS